MTPFLVDGLTDPQRLAVETDQPYVVLVAGAGSGKTETLTRRLAHLVLDDRVDPKRILAVTFTRAAVREMRIRLQALLEQGGGGALPVIRTIHSWGASLLREHAEHLGRTRNFTIYDADDEELVLRWACYDAGDRKAWTRRRSTLLKDKNGQALFETRLRSSDAITFDGIEKAVYTLLQENESVRHIWATAFDHVVIDEFQDTSLTQVAILLSLLPPNFFVVGDWRQAIYRFRGADPSTIVSYARSDERFQVIELPHNFRSRREIIDVANTAVDGDVSPMIPGRALDAGVVRAWSVPDQSAYGVQIVQDLLLRHAPASIFVLGRTWAPLLELAERLTDAGIPVDYLGDQTDVWTTEGARWLVRLLAVSNNPADDNLVQILAETGREPGAWRFTDPTITALRSLATSGRRRLLDILADHEPVWKTYAGQIERAREHDFPAVERGLLFLTTMLVGEQGRMSMPMELASQAWDAMRAMQASPELREASIRELQEWLSFRTTQEKLDKSRPAVRVMTVHASKGLEADAVVMLDAIDGVYPTKGTSDEQAEDLRVWYVGLTRARHELAILVPPGRTNTFTHVLEKAPPSPFVARAKLTIDPWQVRPWGGPRT